MKYIEEYWTSIKKNLWLDLSFVALAGIIGLVLKIVHQYYLTPLEKFIMNIF